MEIKKDTKSNVLEEICIPEYVTLEKKYKCNKCKLQRKTVMPMLFFINKKFRKKEYICKGKPERRTQCKKRCWLVSNLWCIFTTIILVMAYLAFFQHFKDWKLALAYIIIFGVGLDIICCLVENAIDKIFEKMENLRRRNYERKVENIEAINEQKRAEQKRLKEKQESVYKDINEAKTLFDILEREYKEKIKRISSDSDKYHKLNENVFKNYKELMKSIENLLKNINLDNFYFSEIRILFQIHLPKLKEYVEIYIKLVEEEKETEIQINELSKLIIAFNTRVNQIHENLNNSESEDVVYRMQALRQVVSYNQNKEK